MILEITTQTRNCLERMIAVCEMDAPSTFRTPTSFTRRAALMLARANIPMQAIAKARTVATRTITWVF